jgi:arsenate reductase
MTQPTNRPLKILFVCIGNSCRSQMAEAWANHLGNGRVQAFSAGLYPLGSITAQTYEVMAEKGIALEGQWSKGLRKVPVAEMDLVVGMGSEISCPLPADFRGRTVDWEVPDPFGQGIDSFRSARDLIEREVVKLLADLMAPDPSAQ